MYAWPSTTLREVAHLLYLATRAGAEAQALDDAVAGAAAREGFWRKRLIAMTAAVLDATPHDGPATPQDSEVALPRPVSADEATALFAAALSRAADLDAHDLALLRHTPAPGYVSDWVPLHVDAGDAGIRVRSMRTKSNRLEELFVRMVSAPRETAAEARA